MSWRHLSGLLGIALTVKMAGVKKMFVHGPPSVVRFHCCGLFFNVLLLIPTYVNLLLTFKVELMKLTRHFADASTTEVGKLGINGL